MSAIERLLRTIPYVRRPFFQRDAALAELAQARADLVEAHAALIRPKGALSDKFRRTFADESWFVLPSDDKRQNEVVGDLRAYVKRAIPKHAASLEIGPSYSPILPKAEGYAVAILDHADQTELITKYTPHDVDVSRIEAVDFVWRGATIAQSLGNRRFDAIVAAHVIEHAPDFIQFLTDCWQSLNEGGRIYLLVPDKRYAFDYFQPLSDTAKVLGDHRARRTRHSFESFYRLSTAIRNDGQIAWGQGRLSSLSYIHGDPQVILPAAERSATVEEYQDAHENYFTPMSFAMLVRELRYLGEIDLDVAMLTRSRGCEFLIVLQKQGRPDSTRAAEYLAWRMRAAELLMVEELERIEAARGLLFES